MMMHPHRHPLWDLSLCFVIATTLILIRASTARGADDPSYFNCSSTIQCGDLQNVGYPFWGLNRPSYCGLPNFELTCQDDNTTLLNISSQTYRVLRFHDTSQTMTVARNDYWNTICPAFFINTTQEITSSFNYTSDTVASNLTLYYGCQIGSMTPNQFNCTINDTNVISYFITTTTITSLFGGCNTSVVLPANQSAIQAIELNPTNTTVVSAIDEGFGLQWTVAEQCSGCLISGGQCGRDNSSGDFTCYCQDKSTSSTCSGGKSQISLGAALGLAGAGLTGLLVGFGIFSCRQKRNRKRAAAEAQNKSITPPPSSKGLPISSTSFSRTTPSYPTSKSDLDRGSTYFGVQVFSYNELEEATQSFDPSRELGEGGFGTVYYGRLQDGREVAVKRLYENNLKRVEQFMNEVEILTRLRHPNLVTLFGCTSRRSRELLLVYEYIPNGTVADHLFGKRSGTSPIPWRIRLNMAIESADALAYLHKSDVIHRDVKTNNILLDHSFRVKVADFGLSRLFPNDVTHVSTAPQGTPGYVDPEYYQCYQLTDKSDVYSFGVVLCELISSKPAVDTNRHRHDINLASMAINKIQNQTLHELVDPALGYDTDYSVKRMTTLVAELAFRCLQQERDMRPTMEEVVKALKEIEQEEITLQNAEVVDIRTDDTGLVRNITPPFSPESVVTDKWHSDSAIPSSF
ncbi:LEAF RUST 10 DISEASE-RESISTANCE LOCUS RECEPTOR-LIKE PROTEIN KINASE-like 1.4 isoform X3 [Syzygium oleosum]|uniref:LEAF RUST 10 DISEASE-RESISTANCE LOCUS RECEPTOR-LIKE PROTEIN KINASE-like 1.4 isoform X3 n=1 Tax=Syzygium oleosum TaxID=219896 RepID=UPI0024BBE705|nr:LEAF RUST 10 DISEASE-RESISTANCE LOCUS RECEPTOR-LIKE PROTEIN KINASE-like 1.4 isoform X3 [Syzygium oleosum]